MSVVRRVLRAAPVMSFRMVRSKAAVRMYDQPSQMLMPKNEDDLNDAGVAEEHRTHTGIYDDVGFGMPIEIAESKDNASEILKGTNHVEKKLGHVRLRHTIDEQLRYMASDLYERTYKGLPVHLWFRRNSPGDPRFWHRPAKRCVDTEYIYTRNNPCPICRDEYLWFDARNVQLLRQFMVPRTLNRMPWVKSGLCEEQYNRLQAQILRAIDIGAITFTVPFRNYDYAEYYEQWKPFKGEKTEPISPFVQRVEDIRPRAYVRYEDHNPDAKLRWNEWWRRWDKFAQKGSI